MDAIRISHSVSAREAIEDRCAGEAVGVKVHKREGEGLKTESRLGSGERGASNFPNADILASSFLRAACIQLFPAQ